MAEQTPREALTAQIVAKANSDAAFKQELIANPKAVLEKEFGVTLPEGLEIELIEETPTTMCLVLPVDPSDLELPDDLVRKIAAGDGVWDCV